MRTPLAALALLLLCLPAYARKPLIGGPKTIEVPAEGPLAQNVVGAQPGMGGYLSGVKKVAVPLVAVAFETNCEARTSRSHDGETTTRSLKLHLKADQAVLKSIADRLQSIVEADLKAQGFEVLPADTVDADSRWQGIAKNDPVGVEVKDNFMSGFMGNGIFNVWYTSGNRPLFGIGSTGALSELSPLIHIAREKKISLLFYRFKVQFSDVDTSNGIMFNFIEGAWARGRDCRAASAKSPGCRHTRSI